jgi:hypothetical protein
VSKPAPLFSLQSLIIETGEKGGRFIRRVHSSQGAGLFGNLEQPRRASWSQHKLAGEVQDEEQLDGRKVQEELARR